jgi:hypothetical protein
MLLDAIKKLLHRARVDPSAKVTMMANSRKGVFIGGRTYAKGETFTTTEATGLELVKAVNRFGEQVALYVDRPTPPPQLIIYAEKEAAGTLRPDEIVHHPMGPPQKPQDRSDSVGDG